ncbi:MAG TPA: holo-ACP synthase [Desulfomonilaceae bacterium]|nr:holo-ACP synthase [Desulfomonilaceae bacterium]
MILGVGVDLVEVNRMQALLNRRYAARFIERVFSPEERAVCEAATRPAQCYAARFAAKEAVAKAFGTGFSSGVSPGMISVTGGERNRPQIHLSQKAREYAETRNVSAIHVSLTHTATSACAVVVVETSGSS